MRDRPFVIVAGNIGSGKAALAAALADELGLEAHHEPVDGNPYLEAYYEDRSRWAMHSQAFFLAGAIAQHQRIVREHVGAVQVRSLYEQFHVFCIELRDQGILSADEFTVLADLFWAVESMLPAPDLLIFVDDDESELLRRIEREGHEAERGGVDVDYLRRMGERYRAFVDAWHLSPVLRLTCADVVTDDAHDVEMVAAQVLTVLQRTGRTGR